MNDVEVSRYITDTLKRVDVVVDSDNSFFFYNPDSSLPPDHNFPFITIMTNDLDDQVSNLNRPSVFRLNIGVSKQTFRALFGILPRKNDTDDNEEPAGTYDFTALDTVMPHPVYGRMYWLCILSPSSEIFETKVRPLLTEAYEMAVSKYDKQAARK